MKNDNITHVPLIRASSPSLHGLWLEKMIMQIIRLTSQHHVPWLRTHRMGRKRVLVMLLLMLYSHDPMAHYMCRYRTRSIRPHAHGVVRACRVRRSAHGIRVHHWTWASGMALHRMM